MKGYYIQFESNLGVNLVRKIEAQMAEFSTISDMSYLVAGPGMKTEKSSKIAVRVPLLGLPLFNYDALFNQLEAPDFIYFRKPCSDRNMIRFLRKIKEKYPKCKIVPEIFTYPYYKDAYLNMKYFMLIPKDWYYSKKLKKYVDRFVTYSSDDEIFGVKTIKVVNGTDVESISTITPREEDNEIHLLAVAMFRKHHGYERIIKGLNEYYKQGGQKNIKLYMVGDGPEKPQYEKMVSEYKLEDHVIFCGVMAGKELDDIYNKCDIGLGSFGFYKIGLKTASSLKIREYLAKGIAVIAGCEQDVFSNKDSLYYLEFPNDASPVDVNKIVEFHERIYADKTKSRRKIVSEIHTFAEKTVSMKVAFKPILDFIKE